MSRKEKQHHYIYKTTNIINNTYYIGMHSTNNLNDGYIGSGTKLWYYINKYGKENHTCEILEFLPDRKSLKIREREIVNKDLLNEALCINLNIGGGGGWEAANASGKNLYGKNGQIGYGGENLIPFNELKKRLIEEGKWEEHISKISKGVNAYFDSGGENGFLNKQHSTKSKQKMKDTHKQNNHQSGEKNSQFGTCWVYSLTEQKSIKIKKEELEHHLSKGWIKGRK